MTQHYLEIMKQRRMVEIANMILQAEKQGKVVNIDKMKAYCFDEYGMSPKLTGSYLRDLEILGKIRVREDINEIHGIKPLFSKKKSIFKLGEKKNGKRKLGTHRGKK